MGEKIENDCHALACSPTSERLWATKCGHLRVGATSELQHTGALPRRGVVEIIACFDDGTRQCDTHAAVGVVPLGVEGSCSGGCRTWAHTVCATEALIRRRHRGAHTEAPPSASVAIVQRPVSCEVEQSTQSQTFPASSWLQKAIELRCCRFILLVQNKIVLATILARVYF